MKRNRQTGAALFVALMLLLVMTLGALAGMSTSILQERMVGASFQALRAAQRAQEQLAIGERQAYEYVTKINDKRFFSTCTKETEGVDCNSAGGIRFASGLAELVKTELTTRVAERLCGEGDLMAMSLIPEKRGLGESVDEYLFQLTAGAAVCTNTETGPSPAGALPVLVQSYYSP